MTDKTATADGGDPEGAPPAGADGDSSAGVEPGGGDHPAQAEASEQGAAASADEAEPQPGEAVASAGDGEAAAESDSQEAPDADAEAADETASEGDVAPGPSRLERLQSVADRLLSDPRKIAVAAAAISVLASGASIVAASQETGNGVTLVLNAPAHYYELPKLLTDIRPEKKRQHLATATMIVEISEDDVETLESKLTEIMDSLQAVVRDYERADLIGRDGAQRLRSDALLIINRALAPSRARGLLFKEFLVD